MEQLKAIEQTFFHGHKILLKHLFVETEYSTTNFCHDQLLAVLSVCGESKSAYKGVVYRIQPTTKTNTGMYRFNNTDL